MILILSAELTAAFGAFPFHRSIFSSGFPFDSSSTSLSSCRTFFIIFLKYLPHCRSMRNGRNQTRGVTAEPYSLTIPFDVGVPPASVNLRREALSFWQSRYPAGLLIPDSTAASSAYRSIPCPPLFILFTTVSTNNHKISDTFHAEAPSLISASSCCRIAEDIEHFCFGKTESTGLFFYHNTRQQDMSFWSLCMSFLACGCRRSSFYSSFIIFLLSSLISVASSLA